jgi:hypothetical protein
MVTTILEELVASILREALSPPAKKIITTYKTKQRYYPEDPVQILTAVKT